MTSTQMNVDDYEQARRDFHLDVPELFNYTRDIIDVWASSDPEKLALLAVDPIGEHPQRISFGELSARARRAANFLAGLGVKKGDRIFVMLPRIPEWYDVLLGAFHLGAVPMPGTVQLSAKDISYRINRADASVAIVDEDGTSRVDAIRGECPSLATTVVVGTAGADWLSWDDGVRGADDLAPPSAPTRSSDPLLIYFTSGTTAQPKMVLHTHASYGIGHDITARYWQDLRPDDLHWALSDTGWAKAAWGKLFGQWRIGAANFLWNAQGKPDFDLILRLIENHGITTFCAPPTVYRQFVTMDLSQYDFSRLRHTMAAGEPLNADTFNIWRDATGTEIHDGYGQTETTNLIANLPCMEKRPGSMGKPMPGYDVAVVDADGNVAPPGEVGEIAVKVVPSRPIGLFTEYWRDPEATAKSHRGDWYLTGDRAHVDDDGYFWFSSRADDVIITAGYRIGPFEVESAILEHPAVVETAVIGVPDHDRGHVVKAFVVLGPGHDPSDELVAAIQDHVKSITAPYKYPRQIEFIEELPKTVSGKIRRVELRARHEEQA